MENSIQVLPTEPFGLYLQGQKKRGVKRRHTDFFHCPPNLSRQSGVIFSIQSTPVMTITLFNSKVI